MKDSTIFLCIFGTPTLTTFGAIYLAVWSVIQSFAIIPASLHGLLIIIGFIFLFPLSVAAVGLGALIGAGILALLNIDIK